jgi:AP-3 complex subunit delta-1
MLYKIFLKFPDALRPAFPRLKEKLEDPDPGVQSAAVNVVCELARKNPKNYLSLAPIFFKLMTTSTNNWMLIKIIKLVSSLSFSYICIKQFERFGLDSLKLIVEEETLYSVCEHG